MAIQRRLPNTDVARNVALKASKTKQANTAPADMALTAATIAKLNLTQPLFEQKMILRGAALRNQSSVTVEKNAAQEQTKMFISHFIQVFNLGIERGVFPASDRAFYTLDVNSNSVPPLTKESEITYWGEQLITGDAGRIDAGGAAMAMPEISQVQAAYDNFIHMNSQQSTVKDAYDKAQEEVSNMRPDVDKLILKIWDEVETFYNQEETPSKRRHAREWGVVYVSTQKATITGTVTQSIDDSPLANVNVALIESEEIVQTDANGNYKLTTVFTGAGTLEFALEGYVTKTFPVEIPEGGSLVQDAVMVAI